MDLKLTLLIVAIGATAAICSGLYAIADAVRSIASDFRSEAIQEQRQRADERRNSKAFAERIGFAAVAEEMEGAP